MKRARSRTLAYLFVSSSVAAGAAALVVACVDDTSPAVSPTPDGAAPLDSSSTQPPGNDGGTATTDGATDAGPDAEEIVDGGGTLPEEDAGPDTDAGFDAGPACASLTTGAFVDTSCATLAPFLKGGSLETANYNLESVTVLGDKTFCGDGGRYVPFEHRGRLEVTATSATSATFEFLDQYRKKSGIVIRPTSVRYDVSVAASATTLTFTPQACAAHAPPATAIFSSGVNPATLKRTLILRLPYGTGAALYRYVEL